jgi:hypothetical protein
MPLYPPDDEEFPVELNGKTAEGHRIYVKPDGSAYAEVPFAPGSPEWNEIEAQAKTGVWLNGKEQPVPTPEHMKDPVFIANARMILCTNREGSKCIGYSDWGNPPRPPKDVPCPACAKKFAARFVEAERAKQNPPSMAAPSSGSWLERLRRRLKELW